jgi:hypothetical protein
VPDRGLPAAGGGALEVADGRGGGALEDEARGGGALEDGEERGAGWSTIAPSSRQSQAMSA